MCATVCPSQALFFGTREQIDELRPQSAPVNQFQFGEQTISTRVFVMTPRAVTLPRALVDVTAAMDAAPGNHAVSLKVLTAGAAQAAGDPFMDVEV